MDRAATVHALGLTLWLAVLVAPAAGAAALRVHVEHANRLGSPSQVEAALELTPVDDVGESELASIRATVSVPGFFDVDVQLETGAVPRAWRLSAGAKGFWAHEQVVSVHEDGAAAFVTLLPVGWVTGRVPDRGEERPEHVDLRFEASPRLGSATNDIPRTELQCPLEGGRFSCEVPGGVLDLRARLGRNVPEYFWDVNVGAGKRSDLGTLQALAGASIIGTVETMDRSQLPEDAEVVLAPSGALGRDPAQEQRLRALDLTAKVNDRGFFQFEAIPAGQYSLAARAAGYVSVPISAEAWDGLEAVLMEPVGLDRPSSLNFLADPRQPPFGGAWAVRLARFIEGAGRYREVDRLEMSIDGTLNISVIPGKYRAVLEDQPLGDEGRPSRWAVQDLEVGSSSLAVTFSIAVVGVKGNIALGDEPMSGTLWFGGRSSERSVRMVADAEGRFQGVLPDAGEWPVDYQSEVGRERLPLPPVDIPTGIEGGWADVEIRVPDTSLYGKVVDGDGEPLENARVTARILDEKYRSESVLSSDEFGEFRFRGIPPGPVSVQALAGGGESDWVTVAVAEENEPPPIELQVLKRRLLTGRVESAGRPVPGAQVWYFPGRLAEGQTGSAGFEVASPAGQYRLSVPATAHALTVAVMASGYGLLLREVPTSGDRDLHFEVSRDWGSLRLGVGSASGGAILVHDGAAVPLGLLTQWRRMNPEAAGASEDGFTVLPRVEPGFYSLCANVPGLQSLGSGCVGGSLAPHSDAVLVLPN